MTPQREPQDVDVLTFGCRLNLVESEAMRRAAKAAGRTNLVIVNSCAVTAEAERQARQAIRRIKRERPQADIIVTGCAAEIDPARFAAMPEVSRVIGNAEKTDPASWARGIDTGVDAAGIMQCENGAACVERGRRGSHPRLSRGADRLRSSLHLLYHSLRARPIALRAHQEVTRAARRLSDKGFREIVLTGVDLTSYGA